MRLVVETLVPRAHVPDDGGSLEPLRYLEALLGSRRGLGLHLGPLGLLLRRLPGGPLLLDLALQLLDILLCLAELLLEHAKPLLGRGLGGGTTQWLRQREETDDDRKSPLHPGRFCLTCDAIVMQGPSISAAVSLRSLLTRPYGRLLG